MSRRSSLSLGFLPASAIVVLLTYEAGAAAPVFLFLGSGFVLGILYGRTGSGPGAAADVDDAAGSTEHDAPTSSAEYGAGLSVRPHTIALGFFAGLFLCSIVAYVAVLIL